MTDMASVIAHEEAERSRPRQVFASENLTRRPTEPAIQAADHRRLLDDVAVLVQKIARLERRIEALEAR